MFGNDFQAGSKPEMERVAEQNLSSDFIELKRAHCFDGTVGADGHKHGCLNNAVVQMDFSAARKSFSLWSLNVRLIGLPFSQGSTHLHS